MQGVRSKVKRIITFLLCACVLFCGCVREKKNEKLKITATLFPQYDFCRQIAGDRAEVELLLPPGMESHNFEPSVADIEKINGSDLFVFTGENMEPWAVRVINGLHGVNALDVSENIELCDHDDGDEHHDHHEHHEEKDPHIWTDPNNCIIMVRNIVDALCALDGQNADYYKANGEKYIAALVSLDEEFVKTAENAKIKTLVHGGRASMTYFARRYGFEFLSAVDSCSSYSEPSARKLTEMINFIKENNIKVVFFEELSVPKFAKIISEETGAEMLLLHTCHNLSKSDFEKGETYISLMKQNAENIKKAVGE